MAKVIVVLAASSEVEDFYEHFNATEMSKTMGWEYSFSLCDPDTERPSKGKCAEIMKISGLSKEIIGNFSHLLGRFILNTYIDHDNYDLPKDFVAAICSDDSDSTKLAAFSILKGFDIKIHEITATEDNLKYLHGIFQSYLDEAISANQVFDKLGWEGIS